MTATEKLRRMLDERGVEWWDMSDEYEWYTEWVPEMLVKHHHRHRAEPVGFFESTWRKHGEMANGLVLFGNKHHRHCIYDLTPEQAIAATLGDADATPTRQGDAGTCHTVAMDCFGNPPYNTSGLNGNNTACGCSECGAPWSTVGLFRGNQLSHNFKACPICGRKVVDE